MISFGVLKCTIHRDQVQKKTHARPESTLKQNRTLLARRVCQATDRSIPLRNTCDMVMQPHSKVSNGTLYFSQCKTELKPGKIVPVFADNTNVVLTNCTFERKITIKREAQNLVILTKCRPV